MSRIDEIDNFLRETAKYAREYDVDIRVINNGLRRYDLDKEEYTKPEQFKPYFSYWEDYFKNSSNLFVKECDARGVPFQNGFIQFRSNHMHAYDAVKLYVSVDPKSMLRSVCEIFNYFDDNNIASASKVANKARSDSIVLRINDEDVKKAVDFINNNNYLTKNSRKPNPFELREGIVGLAYDGYLSYNSSVAFLISEYINNKKASQELNNVNSIDFSSYVSDYCRKLITDKNFLDKFMQKNYYLKNAHDMPDMDTPEILSNFKMVFDLINFNLNGNHTFDDFMKMHNNSKNSTQENINDFRKLLKEEKKETEFEQIPLLNDYLNVAFSMYDSKEEVLAYLKCYLAGNPRAITRNSNLRSLFQENLQPEKLRGLIDGDIDSYIENYLNQINKQEFFLTGCMATYEKYGTQQLEFAINKSLKSDFSAFTGKYFRNIMKETMSKEDVKQCLDQFLYSKGYEVDSDYGLVSSQLIEEMYIEKSKSK